jgi:succinoglycan biosynthesis protein ExoA
MLEFVSIVVPVLNEERYLPACLDALCPQITPGNGEIIVVDGGSNDRSREIVEEYRRTHAGVRLLDNPARLQSAGVNLAANQADPRSTIVIRADAHAVYQAAFVAACVSSLRQNGASSVVVPMIAAGRGGFQRAAAVAQNARLGNGGSAHRVHGRSGFVEHGHHAAFDRTFFLRLGGYDESFTHNEDAEHDARALAAGGSIWMCATAAVTYFPRTTIRGLARQYRNHGAGRARTMLLHRCRPRLRQLAPVCMLLVIVLAMMAAPLTVWPLLLPSIYLLICCGHGVGNAMVRRDPCMVAAGPALLVMHLCWALGFLSELATQTAGGTLSHRPTGLRQSETS